MRWHLGAALGLALAGPLLPCPDGALAQATARPPGQGPQGPGPQRRGRPAPPPPAAPLAPADSEQIATAELAHYGDYECEFGEKVNVAKTPKHEGYVDVHHGKLVVTMKPVLSSTGALRLEDVKGRLLMLQIANKSMLMDTQKGQRLVDGCVHEKQREAAARPPTESLGIAPKKD